MSAAPPPGPGRAPASALLCMRAAPEDARLPFVWAAGCPRCLATSRCLQLEKPLSLLFPSWVCSARKMTGRLRRPRPLLPAGPRLLDRVLQMVSSQLMPDYVSRDCSVLFPVTRPFSLCWEGGCCVCVCLREGGEGVLEGMVFFLGL